MNHRPKCRKSHSSNSARIWSLVNCFRGGPRHACCTSPGKPYGAASQRTAPVTNKLVVQFKAARTRLVHHPYLALRKLVSEVVTEILVHRRHTRLVTTIRPLRTHNFHDIFGSSRPTPTCLPFSTKSRIFLTRLPRFLRRAITSTVNTSVPRMRGRVQERRWPSYSCNVNTDSRDFLVVDLSACELLRGETCAPRASGTTRARSCDVYVEHISPVTKSRPVSSGILSVSSPLLMIPAAWTAGILPKGHNTTIAHTHA
jgi:hypothetical protein